MILFPAIDIRGGHCVRLTQGDYDREEIFGDPVEMARRWSEKGAGYLHIVDLDGARKGKSENMEIIAKIIAEIDVPVQVGGGIRTFETIQTYLASGVSRVILGSAALYDEALLMEAVAAFGSSIAVSIDTINGLAATDGWTKTSNQPALDFAKKLEVIGLETIIYTDIAKDGMMNGPNFAEIERLNKETNLHVIASGGISSLANLKKLAELNVYGAIIGKALYNGEIDLTLALKEVM